MTPWGITLSSRTDSRGQGARVRGPLAARTNGSTARSESACICGGALRQYNLAQELGEDFNGLKELQGLAKFLETKKPFIGFGESAPVDGSYDDDTESQEDRRVEVLFFEEGQEPNVALLDEDPKVSELYQGDAFRRVEIDDSWRSEVRVVGVEGVFRYVVDTFPLLRNPKPFEIAMRKVFGDDLTREGIEALRRELLDASFPAPEFVISEALPPSVSGAYSSGIIHISREAADSAREDPLGKWKLFTIMVEEYGHYVDDQLRHRLAAGVEADAHGDEGTRFGAFYLSYHELFTREFTFGSLLLRRSIRRGRLRTRLRISEGSPSTEDRTKFFLWAQEEASDSGYVKINGVAYQAEYFKIEGQGAVHERITRAAAEAAGVKFDDRLDIGVAWPDVPTWDENSPPAPTRTSTVTPAQARYNSPHAAYRAFLTMETAHSLGMADKSSPPYKSHYGQNQFWHAMSPGRHLTNRQVVEKILHQHEIWWSWALADRFATVGISLPLGILPQGLFHVGKVLHTVQDSFSESHTIRNAAGEIVSFQDYTQQDASLHGKADKDHVSKELHRIAGAPQAIQHSTAVLVFFRDRRPFDEVRSYLLTYVFVLAPGAADQASGDVRDEYKVRPKE